MLSEEKNNFKRPLGAEPGAVVLCLWEHSCGLAEAPSITCLWDTSCADTAQCRGCSLCLKIRVWCLSSQCSQALPRLAFLCHLVAKKNFSPTEQSASIL